MKSDGFLLPSFLPWALIAIIAGGGMLYISHLKKSVSNLEKEKQILELSVRQITEVNNRNVLIIEKIQADKVKANKLIANMHYENERTKKDLTSLKSQINNMPAEPASQALKETVRGLQR